MSQRPVSDGSNIQRTMRLLATSTAVRRNTVRILIYGQSLSKQNWSRLVSDSLRARFPHANIDIRNLSVGGFAAGMLIHSAEMDIYPFYPDLIILHVYGGEPEKEALIRDIRTRTTAELLLQSDHVTWEPSGADDPADRMHAYEWHNQHAAVWLPAVCRAYGCELVDVRAAWARHLRLHSLRPSQLTTDGVHFNEAGDALMARIVGDALEYRPSLISSSADAVKTWRIGKQVRWRRGRLSLDFEGNRVEAIGAVSPDAARARATVRIDGKPPSAIPDLYTITRPNGLPRMDWPWQVGAMYRVRWNAPLILEDWVLTITRIGDDYDDFEFEVRGSVTGPDGAGRSTSEFVSHSGRVVIEPRFWHLKRAHEVAGLRVGPGYEIKWSVMPLFTDVWSPPISGDPATEQSAVLASSLPNTRHTLTLDSGNGPIPGLAAIRTYRPLVVDRS